MFEKIGRVIVKKPLPILTVTILITLFFSVFIPSVHFDSNLAHFVPENDVMKAQEKVNNYFGAGYSIHMIYASSDNVLDAKSLREGYSITENVSGVNGVEEVISFAGIIDACRVDFEDMSYDEDKGICNCTDVEINERARWILYMMNTNISYLLPYVSYFTSAVNFTHADVEDVKLLSYLLSDDLDITNATADSTVIIVLMNSSKNQDVSLDVKKKIDEIKLTHVGVMQTSDAIVAEDVNSATNESSKILALTALALISVVLFIGFRKISCVIISLATLLVAIIWTLGTMAILEINFTIMSVAVVPLMIGLGVDYPVHISKRYFEETKRHNIDDSTMISVKNTGKALSLALITTMIAFSSNSFSEITPVKEFGIICALGIFYAFAATFLFCLPVRHMIDKKSRNKWKKSWSLRETKKVKYTVETGLQQKIDVLEFKHKNSCKKLGISGVITKHKKTVALIAILITVGAGFAAKNIDSEYSVQDFLPSDWESMQTIERIEKEFSGTSQLESYILIEGNVSNPQILNDMDKTLSNIADDKYAVKIDNMLRTVSVLKYIRYAVSENKILGERFNFTSDGMPKKDADVKGMYDYLYDNTSYGYRMKTVLHKTDNKYDATLIRVFVDSKITDDARIMYDGLKNDVFGFKNESVSVTGPVIITITTIDAIQESQIYSTIVSIVLAGIVLIIVYRKMLLGLIALLPVILASVWILGTMHILGFSLNVLTVTITALTIGLGVDYSIHIVERYREEQKKNAENAVQSALHHSGSALLISAVTTILGFGVLLLSPIPAIQQFGLLTSLTIAYCFLASVLVLPVLLIGLKRYV